MRGAVGVAAAGGSNGCDSGARIRLAFFGSAGFAVFMGSASASVGVAARSGAVLVFAFGCAAGGSRWAAGVGWLSVASLGIDGAAAFRAAALGSSGLREGSAAAARPVDGAASARARVG